MSRYNTPDGTANYFVHAVPAPSNGLAPRLLGPFVIGFNVRRRSRPKTVCLDRYDRLKAVCGPRRVYALARFTRQRKLFIRVSNTHVSGTTTTLKVDLSSVSKTYKISALALKKAGGKLVKTRYMIVFGRSLVGRTHCTEGRSYRLTDGVHCVSYRFATFLRSGL